MKKNILMLILALSFVGVTALAFYLQSFLLMVFNIFGLGTPFIAMVAKDIRNEQNQEQKQDIKFNASTQEGTEYELINNLENKQSTYLSNKTKKQTAKTEESAIKNENDLQL